MSANAMLLLLLAPLLLALMQAARTQAFLVGVGSADATGPLTDVLFMGYAQPNQVGAGLHMRLRARAFVVADDADASRMAFVSLDAAMGSDMMTKEVLERLEVRFPGRFTWDNLFISGTHTHAAPGGFLQYVLTSIPTKGFVRETFEAYTSAVVEALVLALNAMEPGLVKIGTGVALPHSNRNRSPSAYMNNPSLERAHYQGDTDQTTVVLRFERPDGTPVGMFNWFSVHGTSLPNTNLLVSGDNKGYASQLFEAWYNPPGTLPGQGKFVAAFASTSLGDASPNVNGTFCDKSGLPCQELHSTCKGLTEFCHGRGPSQDPYLSTEIIGSKQASAARQVFDAKMKPVADGTVLARSRLVDFSNVTVDLSGVGNLMFFEDFRYFRPSWTRLGHVKTCKLALGFAFAAGTTDGPGDFDFHQADKHGNAFWDAVRNLIDKPSKEMVACQHPKPVLLPTGEIHAPYAWEPSRMSIGVALLGKSLCVLSVPSEFTTMAGRRLRRAMKRVLVNAGLLELDGVVVIAGLSNGYSHYVTTFEEYQVQRYEGASTLFGPHTLAAYAQEFAALADDLKHAAQLPPHVVQEPPDYRGLVWSMVGPPGPDHAHLGKRFGDVVVDAEKLYRPLQSVVVRFVSANPRHDRRTGDSFLTVERFAKDAGAWRVVAVDASFDTTIRWEKKQDGVMFATVTWRIPAGAAPGEYRITHRAASLSAFSGRLSAFQGVSRAFQLDAPAQVPDAAAAATASL
jgi:neutral ceramidase